MFLVLFLIYTACIQNPCFTSSFQACKPNNLFWPFQMDVTASKMSACLTDPADEQLCSSLHQSLSHKWQEERLRKAATVVPKLRLDSLLRNKRPLPQFTCISFSERPFLQHMWELVLHSVQNLSAGKKLECPQANKCSIICLSQTFRSLWMSAILSPPSVPISVCGPGHHA